MGKGKKMWIWEEARRRGFGKRKEYLKGRDAEQKM
jgi:hypothetical protein